MIQYIAALQLLYEHLKTPHTAAESIVIVGAGTENVNVFDIGRLLGLRIRP